MTAPHRATLLVEQAPIVAHHHLAGDQHWLILDAPQIAARARAGSFVHLQVSRSRPLRRPISILRSDQEAGRIELLYKAIGRGTRELRDRQVGEALDLIGPIGQPFVVKPGQRRPLLLGGGVGMPPMIFLADQLRREQPAVTPLVILGSEVPFPFPIRPSQFLLPGMPEGVIGAMPLLEDWGVASRLTSLQGYAGCHQGYVTDLAEQWLQSLTPTARAEVVVMACGPEPMLAAVAALARRWQLPCQVSLEEYMACGVGGCAGCVVEVQGANGPMMKRVCVDGPVFDANSLFAAD